MILLIGCGRSAGDGSNSRTVRDDLGRSLEIPSAPSRVVSLAPGVTEIVFAAGAGDALVAVTTADDYPPEVTSMARVGAYPLNREAVVGQNPDLVLATDQVNSPHDLDPLVELGIPVYFLQFETVDEILGAIRKVGKILGTAASADSRAAELRGRWRSLESRSAGRDYRPRVLLLVGMDVLYTFGADSYNNEMIVVAGGDPITGSLPGQSAVLNDEFVLSNPPDVIFGPQSSGEAPEFSGETLLAHHPSWDVLPAIQNGHVYGINPDLIFRPGPRVIEAAEQMAMMIDAVAEGSKP